MYFICSKHHLISSFCSVLVIFDCSVIFVPYALQNWMLFGAIQASLALFGLLSAGSVQKQDQVFGVTS